MSVSGLDLCTGGARFEYRTGHRHPDWRSS